MPCSKPVEKGHESWGPCAWDAAPCDSVINSFFEAQIHERAHTRGPARHRSVHTCRPGEHQNKFSLVEDENKNCENLDIFEHHILYFPKSLKNWVHQLCLSSSNLL
jgi:hypothetical protein